MASPIGNNGENFPPPELKNESAQEISATQLFEETSLAEAVHQFEQDKTPIPLGLLQEHKKLWQVHNDKLKETIRSKEGLLGFLQKKDLPFPPDIPISFPMLLEDGSVVDLTDKKVDESAIVDVLSRQIIEASAQTDKKEKVEELLRGPVLFGFMKNPVTLPCGHTLDKETEAERVEKCVECRGPKEPMRPNHFIRFLVNELQARHYPETLKEEIEECHNKLEQKNSLPARINALQTSYNETLQAQGQASVALQNCPQEEYETREAAFRAADRAYNEARELLTDSQNALRKAESSTKSIRFKLIELGEKLKACHDAIEDSRGVKAVADETKIELEKLKTCQEPLEKRIQWISRYLTQNPPPQQHRSYEHAVALALSHRAPEIPTMTDREWAGLF